LRENLQIWATWKVNRNRPVCFLWLRRRGLERVWLDRTIAAAEPSNTSNAAPNPTPTLALASSVPFVGPTMAEKVEVQSSRIPDDPDSVAPLDKDYAAQLQSALLASGAVQRIEDAMDAELRKTGWVSDVREYARALLRSGEATTFDEMMACFARAIQAEAMIGRKDDGKELAPLLGLDNGVVNGARVTRHGDGGPVTDRDKQLDELAAKIKIPENVIAAGMGAVKTEIENVVDVTVDDFGGVD